MSRVSTRPGGSSLSLSLRIDRRRRRRDIPRKIVRVLCESQLLADETLRRAISLGFHLNRGRGTIVCVRVFASHIFSFISAIRWDGFLTSQPRRFRIAYCFITDLGYRVPLPFHELLRRHRGLLSRKIHLMLFNSIV